MFNTIVTTIYCISEATKKFSSLNISKCRLNPELVHIFL